MSIIDQTINNVGIQTLDFQLSPIEMISGRCDLLRHSDGSLYAVFAKNYFTNVKERRLYFSRSDDDGLTWLEPVQLTSGYWDDDPALVQLVDASDTSEIGVVFNRAVTYLRDAANNQIPYMYRFTVTQTGTVSSAIDIVTGSPSSKQFLGMCKKSTGEFIVAAIDGGTTTVTFLENDVFLNNSWTSRNISNMFGASPNNIYAARLRKLSNGDFIIMGAIRSALDGTAGQASNLRCDLKAVVSTNDCVSFGAVQSLTSYTAAPKFNLDGGWKSVGDADVVELSDGSLSVVFQEFYPYQALTTTTTPALPSSAGIFNTLAYHAGKNMLFAGSANTFGATTVGLYCVDLTNSTVTRLHQSSTPALWNESIQRVALSADGNYLAVATEGSLDIIDITDDLIENWTITSLRTSTSPALYNNDIETALFDGNTLYFFYGSQSGVTRCVGGFLDVTNIAGGITDILVPSALSSTTQSIPASSLVFMLDGDIIYPVTGVLVASDGSTGAGIAYYALSSMTVNPVYNDIHDEIIITSSSVLKRLSYNGSSFSLIETQNVTGTGDPLVAAYPQCAFMFPGAGSLWYNSAGYASAVVATYYSYSQDKTLGIIMNSGENYHAITIVQDSVQRAGYVTPDTNWYGLGHNGYVTFEAADNKGRLRYANFPYDTGTHTLTTAGVDFYDLVNQSKVGTGFNQIVMPHIWCLADDRIILIAQYFAPAESNRQFGTLIGILEPDAYKLKAKARILGHPTQTFQAKARVRSTVVATMTSKARLIYMGCIKVRANIIPRGDQSLLIRAAIRNWKYTTLPCSLDVEQTRKSRCRLHFYAATGYTTNQGLTIRARIAQTYKTRMTGHLIVPAISDGSATVAFDSASRYKQSMTMKARIGLR